MSSNKLNEKIAQWSWKDHWDRDIEEAISELEREAHVRQRISDRWVAEARLSFIDARDRQERLLSGIRLLREHQDLTTQHMNVKAELAQCRIRLRALEEHVTALQAAAVPEHEMIVPMAPPPLEADFGLTRADLASDNDLDEQIGEACNDAESF